MIVRIVPNVSGLAKRFDYQVPDRFVDDIAIGSVVRADLHGRRIAGWVVEIDPDDAFDGGELSALTRVTGRGPNTDLIGLAEWAAHRWAGRLRHFLQAATPRRVVTRLPQPSHSISRPLAGPTSPATTELLDHGGGVLQLPPTEEALPAIRSAAIRGPALVIEPSAARSAALARMLRREGFTVALLPDDWAAAAGGVDITIGPRIAVWGPCSGLSAVVVLDEHDEALQAEGSPTWHARDVAIERGRRACAPVVLVSPVPTVTARTWAPVSRSPDASRMRRAWPDVSAIDRSDTEPWKRSLLSSELIQELRDHDRTVVCVSNTPGRARLMACRHCSSLTVCETCGSAVRMIESDGLHCARCGTDRPVVCQVCGHTALANVRPGVSRLVDDVAAAAGRPAVLVEGSQSDDPLDSGVFVGTEAVLHRVGRADTVVFLEFDREVLAPRYRAAEQSVALVARAARLVGPRSEGGKVMLQTFNPDHPVVQAAESLDFDALAVAEADRRRLLQLPPFAAYAEVSGVGAAPFIDSIGGDAELIIVPDDEGFAVRASSWDVLADGLDRGVRPPGSRLRIAVDPPR